MVVGVGGSWPLCCGGTGEVESEPLILVDGDTVALQQSGTVRIHVYATISVDQKQRL